MSSILYYEADGIEFLQKQTQERTQISATERFEMMNYHYDVVAVGELLIDFTQYGLSKNNNKIFEANPGGAPCNVLSMLQKFDKKTAFIGKVGKDAFGLMLKETLDTIGICTQSLYFDENIPTTLAFVHRLENGDRDFSFYRNPGADMLLHEEDINEDLIKNCKIFHFGTLSMTDEPVLSATKKAVKIARENNKIISFDPNLRQPLWDNQDDAKAAFEYGMSNCDILKISDNEIQWFTDTSDIQTGIDSILEKYPVKLVLASLGADGSCAYYNNHKVFVPAFQHNNVVDTTGAGDTFLACCLNYVLDYGLQALNETQLKKMLSIANAAASLVIQKKGALKVMPDVDEIMACQKAITNGASMA